MTTGTYIFFFKSGWTDILKALKGWYLAGILGWQDIRQRYRRSSLGPFWLTISMGVLIGALGFVFGSLFRMPMDRFLPFLTCGLIIWTLIMALITEGCTAFTESSAMIKQMSLPLYTYILKVTWRNLVIFGHNIVIFPLVMLVFWVPVSPVMLVAVPGLLLLIINLSWLALFFGVVCTRYRDVPQIVASLFTVFFYMTPIIWMPEMMPDRVGALMLNLNPFYHLIEIVRAPLLGKMPAILNWQVCLLMALAGWFFTSLFFGRFRSRIAYWL